MGAINTMDQVSAHGVLTSLQTDCGEEYLDANLETSIRQFIRFVPQRHLRLYESSPVK